MLISCGAVSGEDGKSRADQLQHLLKNLDQYVASSVTYQRQRACYTVLALLKQFRALCMSGSCPFNCAGNCMHLRSTAERVQSSSAGICVFIPDGKCLVRGCENHVARLRGMFSLRT